MGLARLLVPSEFGRDTQYMELIQKGATLTPCQRTTAWSKARCSQDSGAEITPRL